MMKVLACEAFSHNVWLVLLAALVCTFGCWAVIGLFERALSTSGVLQQGWQFLTGIAAGSTIWCTHFLAMMAYQSSAPIAFDPILTIVSALVATIGASMSFAAASSQSRWAPVIGGVILGLSIAAMHYAGMLAYRVDGLVRWNTWLIVLSVGFAVVFSAVALWVAVRQRNPRGRIRSAGILALAVVGLHFTGMSALTVTPLLLKDAHANPETLVALALAVAGMSLLVIGTGVVSYIIDDETRAKASAQLRDLGMHDPLTGLPNRKNFRDQLKCALELASRHGAAVDLVAIDLNEFKDINDQYGQSFGDAVLVGMAQRIAGRLRPDEFLARVGGDEFAIISPAPGVPEHDSLPTRIIDALSGSFKLGNNECRISASLGLAVFPSDAADAETLISHASLAMFRAKIDRTGEVLRYEGSMDEGAHARRKLAGEMRDAIAKGEFELYFQPQASVADRVVRGFEALARWNHPQLGLVPPTEFIGIAEESGLIEALGEWALRTACRQAASWDPPLVVAVNVSPLQLAHGDLSRLVVEVLAQTGLPAFQLELELTESAVVKDPRRSLKILLKIKALGVSLALDDFGSGHSSLSTLRQFPFDKIKLDRSFMGELETSLEARAVVRTVLALGVGLGIPVLVEGVETEGQLERLRNKGCDLAQGYLLGRPAPLSHWVEQGLIGVKPAIPHTHADAA